MTDKLGQPLSLGDKVVYTKSNELKFGMITKVNLYKSSIREVLPKHNWRFRYENHNYTTLISNQKIYKLD